MSIFSKPKILVTGGAGFIGSHQADALINAGYRVVVVDDLSNGEENNLNSEAKFYKVDIRSEEKMEEIFDRERPEYVFHFAAQANVNRSVEDPIFDADVNIMGSLNLLELSLKYKLKKFMFSSTGGALYGDAEILPTPEDYPTEPISPYGIAKLTVEKYLRFYFEQFGLEYGINRYANVYGPRQNPRGEAGVISIFIEKMSKGLEPIIHGDGHQTRDYVYVGDVVRANMLVFESEAVETYNVGTGRQTTVNEIFNLIKETLGSSATERHSDDFSGQAVSCLSNEKIKRDFSWEPQVNIEEGIEKTVEWFNGR